MTLAPNPDSHLALLQTYSTCSYLCCGFRSRGVCVNVPRHCLDKSVYFLYHLSKQLLLLLFVWDINFGVWTWPMEMYDGCTGDAFLRTYRRTAAMLLRKHQRVRMMVWKPFVICLVKATFTWSWYNCYTSDLMQRQRFRCSYCLWFTIKLLLHKSTQHNKSLNSLIMQKNKVGCGKKEERKQHNVKDEIMSTLKIQQSKNQFFFFVKRICRLQILQRQEEWVCCTVLYFCPSTGFTIDPVLCVALSGTPGVSKCSSPWGTHRPLLVLWLSDTVLVLHSMGRREAILVDVKLSACCCLY